MERAKVVYAASWKSLTYVQSHFIYSKTSLFVFISVWLTTCLVNQHSNRVMSELHVPL